MRTKLFTTYFVSDNQRRCNEINLCLLTNAMYFDEIFVLIDKKDEDVFLSFASLARGTCTIGYSFVDSVPKFNDFFDAISKHGFADGINIIANSDIYFENLHSNDKFFNWLKENPQSCLALSRWDFDNQLKKFVHFNRADSQDTWVFYGIPSGISADFKIGVAGCDNRLAHEISVAGYRVLNPSVEFKTYHAHLSNHRTYIGEDGRAKEVVPQPYLLVNPY